MNTKAKITIAALALTLSGNAFAAGSCDTAQDANPGTQATSAASAESETTSSEVTAGQDGSASVSESGTNTSKTPEAIIDEIVENGKIAADGTKVASTGPAKPVENWFGCPPKTPRESG